MDPSTVPALSHRRSLARGFTLVELMVAVSLVAIIAGLGVPSFRGFMERQSVSAQVEVFTSSVRFTRSSAVRTGRPVTMCRSADPGAASPTCVGASGTNDWSTGWIIFEDLDRDGVVDANETILRVVQPSSSRREIEGQAAASLTFGAMGVSSNAQSRFTVKPKYAVGSSDYNAALRSVCVSRPGRVSVVVGSTC